jgi:hypothetical protein
MTMQRFKEFVNESVHKTFRFAKDLCKLADVRTWPHLLPNENRKIIKMTGVGNDENKTVYYLSTHHFINKIPTLWKPGHYDYLVCQSFLNNDFVDSRKPKIFFTMEPWGYMTPETRKNLHRKELEPYMYRYDEPNVEERMFYAALIKKNLRSIIAQRKKKLFEKRPGLCCIISRYIENDELNLWKHRVRFVQAMGADIDVYGRDPWHGRNKWRDYNNYKGPVSNKIKTLSNYTFAITFENTDYAGYITEKIFDALLVGTIPLYCGGGGYLKEMIPYDCYIDCCNQNPETIYLFIKYMSQEEIEHYRVAAIEFLESSFADRFTWKYLAQNIIRRLMAQEL